MIVQADQIKVGFMFTPKGRNQVETLQDILTTTNLSGEVVDVQYLCTHNFCGQLVSCRYPRTTLVMSTPYNPDKKAPVREPEDNQHLERFMKHINDEYGDSDRTYTTDKGKVNIRVVCNEAGGNKYVYCFIKAKTGDVLKAAGWKGPAKHARGSILGGPENYGIGPRGALYLR